MSYTLNLLTKDVFESRINALKDSIDNQTIFSLLDGFGQEHPVWYKIRAAIKMGYAPQILGIGDYFDMVVSGNNIGVEVIGIDHETPSDSSILHTVTFQYRYATNKVAYDSGSSNIWRDSSLRNSILKAELANLPKDLANCIIPVQKDTVIAGGSSTTTSDYLFVPTATEVYGPTGCGGTAYEYYIKFSGNAQNPGDVGDDNRRGKLSDGTSYVNTWLRDGRTSSNQARFISGGYGDFTYTTPSNSTDVYMRPMFAIG